MSAVRMEGIERRFGAVRALRGASLEVEAGSIHALVGENGAGKSTLLSILAGLLRPDAGRIRAGEKETAGWDAAQAIAAGVGMVHQHFMLVPTLDVTENVVLGNEPSRLLDLASARRSVAELSKRFGLSVDPAARVSSLGVGQAQRVEILKALARGARVLALDEPTAVLSPPEIRSLFAVLRSLAAAGTTVILVTHRLGEVMELCDTVTVMRRGETVLRRRTSETNTLELSRAMVGGDVPAASAARTGAPGPVSLEVEGLAVGGSMRQRAVNGLSLSIRAGEILGIAGVEGNGQTELVEALAGLRPAAAGSMRLGGTELGGLGVAARMAFGISHVPEDRRRRGLVLELPVEDNLILGRQARFTRRGLLDRTRIRAHATERVSRWDIRPDDPGVMASALSGGNQQKVVVARELDGEVRLLLAAQPARGVDLGALARIHQGLFAARDAGAAVLLVSADLAEVLALSDRVAVMYRGRIAVERARSEASEAALGPAMTGAAEVA